MSLVPFTGRCAERFLAAVRRERSDDSACELVNERPSLPVLPPGSRAVPALPPLTDLSPEPEPEPEPEQPPQVSSPPHHH